MEYVVWAYRQLFWCRRELIKYWGLEGESLKIEIPSHKLPWLWIGVELESPLKTTTLSVTEMVNQHVRYGIPVTPEFLEEVTGYVGTSWKYMDSQTLEEKEFPSEGIVINGP